MFFEGFGNGEADCFGPGKNDHALTAFVLQHPFEGLQLLGGLDQSETLTDATAIGTFGANRDLSWIVEVFLGEATDLRRHGGREEHDLTGAGELLKHPLDIVDETHAQHFVGLIKHEGPQTGNIQSALADVVHDPARGTDDDLDAPTQLLDLVPEIDPAVNRQYAHLAQQGRRS